MTNKNIITPPKDNFLNPLSNDFLSQDKPVIKEQPNNTAVSTTQEKPGGLDKNAVAMARAIKRVETPGGQAVPGGTGEIASRYQFLPATWKGYAKEVLGDENAPVNDENENKVAYTKIKQWIDGGDNIGQVASRWNSGSPDHYNDGWRKTDPITGKVLFDTPAYAAKVAKEFRNILAEDEKFNPAPFSSGEIKTPDNTLVNGIDGATTGKEPGILSDLVSSGKERVTQGTQAIKEGLSGKIKPLSAVLQTAGAIAGGLGDVTNIALEHIPVVKNVMKSIEGVVGAGAKAFLGTQVGQNVAKSVSDWATQNPETAKNIGATFNILTAIPILKGIGTASDIALNTTAKILEKRSISIVAKDFAETAISKAKNKAASLLNRNPEIYKEMISNRVVKDVEGDMVMKRLLPDIVEDKGGLVYDITDASNSAWNNVNDLESKIKDRIAGNLSARQTGGNAYLKVADTEKIAQDILKKMPNADIDASGLIDVAKKLDPMNSKIWDKFANGELNLTELNELRSSIGEKLGSKVWDAPDVAFNKDAGKNIYGAISDYIKKEAPETAHLFNETSKQLSFIDGLKLLENKSPKIGKFGNVIKYGAGALGELAGNSIGVSMAGGFGAYQAAKYVSKKLGGGISQGLLKRSPKILQEGATGKLGGLLGAAMAQKKAKGK